MLRLAYSDECGSMFDEPGLAPLGRSWDETWEVRDQDVIPMPDGSTLTMMPERQAVGMSRKTGEAQALWLSGGERGDREAPGWAVAALLPTGFTRTLLPAYVHVPLTGRRPRSLPLFGYTAVGMRGGRPYVAALKTDDASRWDPRRYNTADLGELVWARLAESLANRVLRQLARCALEYGCFTAQNVFYRRWEAGIPVSPACSAACVGCISLQPAERGPSPQERIAFVPTLDEIVEIAVPHLNEAQDAIVSFGQGCEGEPLLQADLIAASIRRIRAATDRGIINVNTNAGSVEGTRKLCGAGLGSMRVTLVSARREVYDLYHRPRTYRFEDVEASVVAAKGSGAHVSVNLLAFPGLTDREEELDAVCAFVDRTRADMVQLRNLNADPDAIVRALPGPRGKLLGLTQFVGRIQESLPRVRIGSHNLSQSEIRGSAQVR